MLAGFCFMSVKNNTLRTASAVASKKELALM